MNARNYFDDGVARLGLHSGSADMAAARESFRQAITSEPKMCDAWMGLAMSGEVTVETLRGAYESRDYLHWEVRRLGLGETDLAPTVPTAGYITIYPYTGALIGIALAALLTVERQFGQAEQLLAEIDLTGELPSTALLRVYVGACLYYVARRWDDLLGWTAQPIPSVRPDIVGAAAALLTGIAHTGLGEYGEALQHLQRVDTIAEQAGIGGPDGPAALILSEAAFQRGMCQRSLGKEDAARTAFAQATANGVPHNEAVAALADPTYTAVVTTREVLAARTNRWDETSGPTVAEFSSSRQQEARAKALTDAEAELDKFIGLDEVKDHVRELKAVQMFDQKMAARGVQMGERSALHAVPGPPGTGKTSIARVVAKIYFGLGILDSPEVIEKSRPDLVGGVIGETEAKTGAILAQARGRGLFIDEAYTLFIADNERDFGRLAIDIIMKFAEDHRHDTVIFLAGYRDKLDGMFGYNPGMRGRFPNMLEFRSNTKSELVAIAETMTAQSPFKLSASKRMAFNLSAEARAAFASTAEWACNSTSPDPEVPAMVDYINNGRFARNVIEAAIVKAKVRVMLDEAIDVDTAGLDTVLTISEVDMKSAIAQVLRMYNVAVQ
ncbi:AAA family ATPase [Mycolicibacterium aubagnense]|uniref:ESX-3 secretion system protein EccA3 n=1 Tax=Mycolicibacterium aubagnense TaxID=319707 RepID=A0ABN5Z246_9MYCO|nr:AAA family ATPase [Mycolicibacterium aubagnense]BBX88073.1 ESX-3 secretion system protein EccA3 [Mycolicibacterium aubagnense]